MAVAWSAFFTLIAPEAPGAADIAIEAAACRAAIEFCVETGVNEKTLANIATVQDQADYTIVAADEVVTRLLSVRLDTTRLEVLTPVQIDDLPYQVTAAQPWAAALTGPLALRLLPAPPLAGQQIGIRAAMRPSQAATGLDDAVFERYAIDIAAGAVARLVPERVDARLRFLDAIGKARVAVLRNHSRAESRARINWC